MSTQIVVTESRGIKIGTNHYALGDTVTISDQDARICIDNGWAKDADTGEIGDRVEGVKKLKPEKTGQKT